MSVASFNFGWVVRGGGATAKMQHLMIMQYILDVLGTWLPAYSSTNRGAEGGRTVYCLCEAGVAMSDSNTSNSSRLLLPCGGVILVESDKASEQCVFTGATTCRCSQLILCTPAAYLNVSTRESWLFSNVFWFLAVFLSQLSDVKTCVIARVHPWRPTD